MEEKVFDGTHYVTGNMYENKHTPAGSTVTGYHIQNWFGDRFILGIQDENLNFILDEKGNIIFEE